MQWLKKWPSFGHWRAPRHSAWGAFLGQEEILVVSVALQKTGGFRAVVFEHLHEPSQAQGLSQRDDAWVHTLKALAQPLPKALRTLSLAVSNDRCRQGQLAWHGPDPETSAASPNLSDLPPALQSDIQSEVQLEAASAWSVRPSEVAFDFHLLPTPPQTLQEPAPTALQVQWAACLREQLLLWQQHARRAGWRLPMVEPEQQAAQRAVLCLQGQAPERWSQSPLDWQFATHAQRQAHELDWPQLQDSPLWKPLVACGAALGALV